MDTQFVYYVVCNMHRHCLEYWMVMKVFVCVCVCVRARVYMHIYACVCVCTHMYIRTLAFM